MKQPSGSKLCGQVCLALILGISLDESIKLVGHRHGTSTKELTKHFDHGDTRRWLSKDEVPDYALCISRPGSIKRNGNWHWVLLKNLTVLDPSFGEWEPFNKWCRSSDLTISSYISILIKQ